MRKCLVAGNWKMFGSRSSVSQLLHQLQQGSEDLEAELVVLPSCVFLDLAQQLLSGSAIAWGAQNFYPVAEGAYTGEISPTMLKDFGCQYVVVGHSERRCLFKETNDEVAAKAAVAVAFDLKPIICVGETGSERDAGETYQVIAAQLAPIIQHEQATKILQVGIIAYEPVWAIGTGLTPSPEDAQGVHQFIRQEIEKIDKILAERLRILYGGSVKKSNAAELFAMPDIDGGLVGGASLNAQEFLEIAKSCHYS